MSDAISSARPIRLGTRGSKLARWQADWVAEQLRKLGYSVDILEIATRGDAAGATPIGDIGTGVFTKEIQRAVLAGTIDVAVHSLKDLPTEPTEALILAAVPRRESVADVLVIGKRITEPMDQDSSGESSLPALPRGATVGTGSVRRQAQLLHVRRDLHVQPIRGNVDTRLAKLDAGEYDAIVLAEAGLKRLGLASRISQKLSLDVMLPAVGQGALGIECRTDDPQTRSALSAIDDPPSHAAVLAERALLAQLRGGCLAPVGAHAQQEGEMLRLSAVVLSADGRQRIAVTDSSTAAEAEELGRSLAERLLSQGAAQLIAGSRA